MLQRPAYAAPQKPGANTSRPAGGPASIGPASMWDRAAQALWTRIESREEHVEEERRNENDQMRSGMKKVSVQKTGQLGGLGRCVNPGYGGIKG